MPARRILQLGDPTLRLRSEPVAEPAEAVPVLRDLCDTLAEFRRTRGFGRGISAIQIGVPLRLIYIEFEGVVYPLINPQWEEMSVEKCTLWDDCFSFPNLMVQLERSVSVRLRYQETGGGWRTLAAAGALSELLQHEMDHLEGVLAIDRALDRDSFAMREEWERRLRGEKLA